MVPTILRRWTLRLMASFVVLAIGCAGPPAPQVSAGPEAPVPEAPAFQPVGGEPRINEPNAIDEPNSSDERDPERESWELEEPTQHAS